LQNKSVENALKINNSNASLDANDLALYFLFARLESAARSRPFNPKQPTRPIRFVRKRVPNVKIGAKVRDVSTGEARSKRSLKNRTVRPFFQTRSTQSPFKRLKSRAERRSFDVGLRSSAPAFP
jgi:hypothetical protein